MKQGVAACFEYPSSHSSSPSIKLYWASNWFSSGSCALSAVQEKSTCKEQKPLPRANHLDTMSAGLKAKISSKRKRTQSNQSSPPSLTSSSPLATLSSSPLSPSTTTNETTSSVSTKKNTSLSAMLKPPPSKKRKVPLLHPLKSLESEKDQDLKKQLSKLQKSVEEKSALLKQYQNGKVLKEKVKAAKIGNADGRLANLTEKWKSVCQASLLRLQQSYLSEKEKYRYFHRPKDVSYNIISFSELSFNKLFS